MGFIAPPPAYHPESWLLLQPVGWKTSKGRGRARFSIWEGRATQKLESSILEKQSSTLQPLVTPGKRGGCLKPSSLSLRFSATLERVLTALQSTVSGKVSARYVEFCPSSQPLDKMEPGPTHRSGKTSTMEKTSSELSQSCGWKLHFLYWLRITSENSAGLN